MKKLLILSIVILSIISCKEEDFSEAPNVITTEISNESEFLTLVSGSVSSDGGADVTERGICYGINHLPSINDQKSTNGIGIGDFTSELTDIEQGVTYYARAFASNKKGTAYGDEVSFIAGTVADIDGNLYNMVTIGTQVWMKENLLTTKYNDGTPIDKRESNATWQSVGAKYCWYNNGEIYGKMYGALYSWEAVNTGKICPIGWHVPAIAEFETLISFLGGFTVAAAKLKSVEGWSNSTVDTGTTNSSGFTALPGGYRSDSGPENFHMVWHDQLTRGWWWTSEVYNTKTVGCYTMHYGSSEIHLTYLRPALGLSVRCLKD